MLVPTLTIQNAGLMYENQWVFEDLSLQIKPKTWICLLGKSGVGKSSLLRMLAGLTQENETRRGNLNTDNSLALHQQIAYLAQDDLLLPWCNVLENVLLSPRLQNLSKKLYLDAEKNAKDLLARVGLNEALHLYPHQLSGGMRQRVALARTLIQHKPIILMDEPFSKIDAITRYKLQNLSIDLLNNHTVIFVTHDPYEALRLADKIYLLRSKKEPLKLIANLNTPKPRDLKNPDIIELHAALFKELIDDDNS